MCPDRQIVSLYCDGELPSPWKEKLEAHLESCAECRDILTGYKNIREHLRNDSQETVQAASERVWKKLAVTGLPENAAVSQTRRTGRQRVWSRTVTLPLPAAVAAVLVIIGFLAFMVRGNASRPLTPTQDSLAVATAANIGFDEQGMLDIQDMDDVRQYLSAQDNIEYMVIRIPESLNFSRSGEPALINAADYSRRSSSR